MSYNHLKVILKFTEATAPFLTMPLRTSLYLKSNTLRSRKSKRREPLSVHMISQPLGDFRHLSHIGMDIHGDVFGDLSFLKRVNSLPNESSLDKLGLGAEDAPPPPKPPRLELGEGADTSGRRGSQRHVKCHSLPLLDTAESDEPSSDEDPIEFTAEVRAEHSEDPSPEPPASDDDSPFSLSLDLGPSILEDVLRVMDQLN